MKRIRVVPILLLDEQGLYKTKSFKNPVYIGDPINAVQIFNKKEVDELIIIDYTSREKNNKINFDYLKEIVSESFMPICYGGNINSMEDCEKLFKIGLEKVSLNYAALNTPQLISNLSKRFGNQSIVVSLDIKRNIFNKPKAYINRAKKVINENLVSLVKKIEKLGAGELLITSVDREGKFNGYDIDLIKLISDSVSIPVISNGGANSLEDMVRVVLDGNASAVAAGSMFVFWGKLRGILINYPSEEVMFKEFYDKLN